MFGSSSFSKNPWRWLVYLAILVAFGIGSWITFQEVRARSEYNQALAFIEKREYSQAISHLEKCFSYWSSDGEVAYLLARTARRAKDLAKAEEYLTKATKLNWVEPAIQLEKALIQAQKGQLRLVEEMLVRHIRNQHPDSLLILETIAPLYVRSFSAQLGKELLEKWMELDPNNPQPFVDFAEVATRIGSQTLAIQALQKGLEKNSESYEIHIHLAALYLDNQKGENAKPHIDWLIGHKPEEFEVRFLKLQCDLLLNRLEEASTLVDQLLKEQSQNARLCYIRGKLDLDAQRTQKAEEWLRKAYQLMPYDLTTLYNLALCLEANQKTEEAQQLRKKFAEVEEELTRASKLMREIVEEPGKVQPRIELAQILMKTQQAKEAEGWLLTALEINPRNTKTHEALIQCYEKMNNSKQAAIHREILEQIQNPNLPKK
jgi:tetratricopeptide (TPR) repeat protein